MHEGVPASRKCGQKHAGIFDHARIAVYFGHKISSFLSPSHLSKCSPKEQLDLTFGHGCGGFVLEQLMKVVVGHGVLEANEEQHTDIRKQPWLVSKFPVVGQLIKTGSWLVEVASPPWRETTIRQQILQ